MKPSAWPRTCVTHWARPAVRTQAQFQFTSAALKGEPARLVATPLGNNPLSIPRANRGAASSLACILLLTESDFMSVPMASLIALGFGACGAVIGMILLLVAAFRQSIVWGLVVLFLPVGSMVYACVHWADAKTGFLANLIGTGICLAGLFSIPMVQEQFWASVNAAQVAATAPSLEQQIEKQRQKMDSLQTAFTRDGVELTKQYQSLDAQRKALKPANTAAISRFNEDAAAYQARNLRRKQMQQDITAAQKQLDTLLASEPHATTALSSGK